VFAVITPLHCLYELHQQTKPNQHGNQLLQAAVSAICFLVDDLILPDFFEQGHQHELKQFSAVCGKAGMNISSKTDKLLCFSRNPGQSMPKIISV